MSQSTTLPANITIGVDLGDKVSQTYVVDAEGRCQDQAPVRHRSEQAPQDLALLKARDQVVKLRTDTINHVRGTVKVLGHRLPRCSAEASSRVAEHVPDAVAGAVPPLLQLIATFTAQIRAYDRRAARGARGEECEEARRGRGGAQAGRAAAPSLDHAGDL